MANNDILKPDWNGEVVLRITSGGSDIDCMAYLESIEVSEEFNRIATATISLFEDDADDFSVTDSDTFEPGKEVEIFAGYGEAEEKLFSGVVVRQKVKISKGFPKLVITAKHSAFRMTLSRQTARFEDQTDSEVVSDIIGKYGISAEVEDTSVKHESAVQFNATDWDYINMRTEANGLLLLTTPDGISVVKPDPSAEPVIQIDQGFSMIDMEAELDGMSVADTFKASAFNFTTQEMEEVEAQTGGCDSAQGNIDSADLSLKVKCGERFIAVDGMVANPDAITELAAAQMMRSSLARLSGTVTFPGAIAIHPGNVIKLENVAGRVGGNAYVTSVLHQVKSGQWKTCVRFGLDGTRYFDRFDDINAAPASGVFPAVNGLHVAKVEQLQDDPLGENRILVKLLHGEETTVWARVALLDAGNSRGSWFMPEIGDEVIVGFVNDNPNLAVVLGMLHSSSSPSPVETSDDNNIKGFFTREKMKLEFDDSKKSITLETPGGNKVVISDDAKGIAMEDQNGNKITMDSNGITIESAKALELKASQDVKISGANVTAEANASFKATGNSGAEVSTSAIAVLKGSIVQIN